MVIAVDSSLIFCHFLHSCCGPNAWLLSIKYHIHGSLGDFFVFCMYKVVLYLIYQRHGIWTGHPWRRRGGCDKISSCNGSFDQVLNNIKLLYVESYICYVVLVYKKLFIESLYYLLIFGDGGNKFIKTWFHGPIFYAFVVMVLSSQLIVLPIYWLSQ